ncbi:phosphofurin acidic cluster sorting protein 2-like [Actinia tenebrosa]|uniref:Phosphofurin acidic cluster sorting protein 2-like n=1 Tax=Actinia tenebrosa TaxID=6105 RepID=A0A6P8HYY0_ACTTE|nr:phosphofurin acidic cluster sorting protein 2-like [Actinia tenebrosa]
MADQGKSRTDGREISVSLNPERPVPMKFFATWEVERTSPNCIPRICNLKLTRLEVIKCLEANLTEVIISVSMQGSRRTLRSNEIILRKSGLIDTELDLAFSLQYPHFLKRNGNNLQIMLQRRKRYKNRTILGFKTLAVGVVNMGQVLQFNMDNQLKLYAKGSSSPVARFTVSSLTSQPVDTDVDRNTSRPGGPYDREGESSDDEDDYSMSDQEASDSGGDPDMIEDDPRRGRKLRHGKIELQAKHQSNFKKKFIALLKKFKVADEELESSTDQYLDIDMSPPENEMITDDFLFGTDDLDDESDFEADFLDQDNVSISSTPKPSLRPFFDMRSSCEIVPAQAKINEEDEPTVQSMSHSDNDERHTSTETECNIDTLSPPSEMDTHSDNTSTSDPTTGELEAPLKRSTSFKERDKSELIAVHMNKRRKSDIELQLPKRSLSDQLTTAFPSNDQIPENVLLVNTAEWQGQLLALKLWDQDVRMICTRCNSDLEAVFSTIVSKYQKFCNNNSCSPPSIRIGIAGSEPYISAVLRPYVEQLSSKPPDWQSYIRFLVIPFGALPIAKYLAALDSTYNSMFMDTVWKEAFEQSQSTVDFNVISERVTTYMTAKTVIHNLPIAEALINTKHKGTEEGSSQVFVPFVCDVRIGSTDPYLDDEVITTSGQPSSTGTQPIQSTTRGDQQAPTPAVSQSPPAASSSPPNKESGMVTFPSQPGNELMDLQVDYWLVAGNKKEATKCSLKTTFKSLVVTRLPTSEEPSALSLMAVTKERKQRGFESMMRSIKKTKEKDPDSKNQPIVANLSKLICTTKGQSSTLNVIIDGVQWSEVKFFSLSSQWPTHVKQFPIGLFSRVETNY